MQASFFLVAAAAVLLSGIAFISLNALEGFLQVPADVWPLMRSYLSVIFCGIFATFMYNYFASLLRALGNSVIPLVFLAVSALLNIALDLGFVLILRRGVAGAAKATVIAQFVSGVGIALYTWICYPQLRSGRCRVRLAAFWSWPAFPC